jgi:hypothetical protein
LHFTRHADGVGAAAAGICGVLSGLDGEAEAVLGMRIGVGILGVGDQRRKEGAKSGDDFVGGGGGRIGKGLRAGSACLKWQNGRHDS